MTKQQAAGNKQQSSSPATAAAKPAGVAASSSSAVVQAARPPDSPKVGPQSPANQMRCYLCETPKQEYSLVRSFSEPVCRGCVNYEGPDWVEQLIVEARRLKAQGSDASPLGVAPELPSSPGKADPERPPSDRQTSADWRAQPQNVRQQLLQTRPPPTYPPAPPPPTQCPTTGWTAGSTNASPQSARSSPTPPWLAKRSPHLLAQLQYPSSVPFGLTPYMGLQGALGPITAAAAAAYPTDSGHYVYSNRAAAAASAYEMLNARLSQGRSLDMALAGDQQNPTAPNQVRFPASQALQQQQQQQMPTVRPLTSGLYAGPTWVPPYGLASLGHHGLYTPTAAFYAAQQQQHQQQHLANHQNQSAAAAYSAIMQGRAPIDLHLSGSGPARAANADNLLQRTLTENLPGDPPLVAGGSQSPKSAPGGAVETSEPASSAPLTPHSGDTHPHPSPNKKDWPSCMESPSPPYKRANLNNTEAGPPQATHRSRGGNASCGGGHKSRKSLLNQTNSSTAGQRDDPVLQVEEQQVHQQSGPKDLEGPSDKTRFAQQIHPNSKQIQPQVTGIPHHGGRSQVQSKGHFDSAGNGAESAAGDKNAYDEIRCLSCNSHLEHRHFVQCPTVKHHKFCFNCSKISIRQQRAEQAKCGTGQEDDKSKKCLFVNESLPWTFMNNEIETIFRESSRAKISLHMAPQRAPDASSAPVNNQQQELIAADQKGGPSPALSMAGDQRSATGSLSINKSAGKAADEGKQPSYKH